MKLIPAIDLKDNKCVRLSKGIDESSEIFNTNPEEQAIFFQNSGCKKIHIVDLDAAFGRSDINLQTIKKIRPGHGLLVKNGKIKKVFQWWKPRNFSYNVNDFTSENLRLLLENAVSKRIKADVEVGSFLSGGIDSSSISFIASKEKNKNLKTYALGLDKDDEDLKRARIYSKTIKSDHKEFYFDPIEEWNAFKNISNVCGI